MFRARFSSNHRHSAFRLQLLRARGGTLGALVLSSLTLAQATENPALLRAGQTQVTLHEARARMQQLPPARWERLGATDGERKRQFVHKVLIPQVLMEEHARAQLTKHPHLRNAALAQRLEAHLQKNVVLEADAVEEYYRRHRAKYLRPPAILIWQIVTDNPETAQDIIRQVKQAPQAVDVWSQLARQHSQDRATKMRMGSLGFVQETGMTDVPQVRVRPETYAAAAQLKDGELLAEPLVDGTRHTVIWRRGTRPELQEPLSDVEDDIRMILVHEAAQQKLTSLTTALRKEHLVRYEPDVLERVDYSQATLRRWERTRERRPSDSQRPEPTTSLRGDR